MLFAGALARRLGADSREKPTFPFTVEPVAVGYGCSTESHASRAELWVPLWDMPFSYAETQQVFSEGRAQLLIRR